MDKVGVEGDASKSRTFLLSYLWLPVRGAAAASSDIVTCCNLQFQPPGTCIIVSMGQYVPHRLYYTHEKGVGKYLRAR